MGILPSRAVTTFLASWMSSTTFATPRSQPRASRPSATPLLPVSKRAASSTPVFTSNVTQRAVTGHANPSQRVQGLQGRKRPPMADPTTVEHGTEAKLRARAADIKHPGYYLNAITDSRGQSPSKELFQTALETFERYCSSDNQNDLTLANRIDNASGTHKTTLEQTQAGFRKYPWNGKCTNCVDDRMRVPKKLITILTAIVCFGHCWNRIVQRHVSGVWLQ